uniref:Uncharacterized protein n=1 Tax=Chromera velia CCMP2878 TaxID=1169474 RepID=A0A0G4HAM9_9ALVE|eukprot:Cvel_25738.t1-p1 / transcript=Cvel_25738.t1 / gene=Cvel_25738 / organism=Chromera_velia_CCMP2878 / gene_product=hypothetical protein / transcript_product=hypothetical protein / location=Cvel_scaffold2959:15300-18151(-) / protein_length=226 / sequence_SO=supercontig / SO=protein_coding / is_pseudo=false
MGVQILCLALSSPKAASLRSLSIELRTSMQHADPAEIAMFSMALASGRLCALEDLLVEVNFDVMGAGALRMGLGSGVPVEVELAKGNFVDWGMLAELLDAVISAGEFEELPLTAHQKGTFFLELRAWRGQAYVAEQRELWGIFLYGAGGFYTDSGKRVFTFSCDSARTLFGVEGWRYAWGSKGKSANELLGYYDDDADSFTIPGMGCPAVVVYIRPTDCRADPPNP